MATIYVDTDSNHDDITSRVAGDTLQVRFASKLTIDSDPVSTPMGILGDLGITSGEIHIDGRYVREIAYSSGSGTFPTTCPTSVSWGSGATAGTGKIIRYDSGTGTSGVLTLTRQSGVDPNGTITDGTWSATVDSSKVGYLKIFCVASIWDTTDADSVLRINGDWYELGVGDGTDGQTFTLPHAGIQGAVWVETGNGTGVFEIWHRVYTGTLSAGVFFDSLSQWGATYESGKVFSHPVKTSTITFGTSTAGGAPPNGARVRIPNVHIGAATVVDPVTETFTATSTTASRIQLLDAQTNENAYLDHVNASTGSITFYACNEVVISDSVFTAVSNFGNTMNSPVTLTNCAFIHGTELADDYAGDAFNAADCVGGFWIEDCVFLAGQNGMIYALNFTTSTNITFAGRNKIVSNQQDETSIVTLTFGSCYDVAIGEVIVLNGGMTLSSVGTATIDNFIFGTLQARGTTEDTQDTCIITGASNNILIKSGRLATGSIKALGDAVFSVGDCNNVTIRNFGEVDNKIDLGGRGGNVFITSGICRNTKFQRCYFTNCGTSQLIVGNATNSDIRMDNCSTDYNDELELDMTRSMLRGVHCGSGALGVSSGIEDDIINVLGTCFADQFTSDTTGGLVLVFNDPGTRLASYVTKTAGRPVFNGLGDLLLQNLGDQVVFEWPYQIKGHTGFQNAAVDTLGVNTTTHLSYEYALDTGSGYGAWTTINGTNLSAETISPAGFGIKVRITCTTASTTTLIRGFRILTTTTLAAQKANYYPLDEIALTFSGVNANSEIRIYRDSDGLELAGIESCAANQALTLTEGGGEAAMIRIVHPTYKILEFPYTIPIEDTTIPIQQIVDRWYSNPA